MNEVPDPATQTTYQVRFEWGESGLKTLAADVDAIIWVDQYVTEVVPSIPGGSTTELVTATLADAARIAEWALARQVERGHRFSLAVIAAGTTRADGSLRCGVDDLLAAGGVIEAVAGVGIDYQSPEAAVAGAAYQAHPHATGSLLAASVGGREARARESTFS